MVKDIPGSFRDPSGSLFIKDGALYRQITIYYKEDYDCLMNSGLYENLVSSGLLIPHKEVDIKCEKTICAYKVIKPDLVPFISYPYEWCFSQLKDAALLTLEIQKVALKYGMTLKDCSAYNVQFLRGRPIWIDTLSFERYKEGRPWVAYRQFCQHFLAPLALMRYVDIRLSRLLQFYIDGIPLDLASSLLPFSTRFNMGLVLHVHLHSKAQRRYAGRSLDKKKMRRRFGLRSFLGLVDSLESSVRMRRLNLCDKGSQWSEYYAEGKSYTEDAISHKMEIVSSFFNRIAPKSVWDFGANTGVFSRIASDKGVPTISFDMDPICVEMNYLTSSKNRETNILPLLVDLVNPSPDIGWENEERMSLLERGPVDCIFALALIHHLAISNNLPFSKIASFFKKTCEYLIIEFIPKDDEMVQSLLGVRDDIFTDYTQENFEREFGKLFQIQDSIRIRDSKRTLYLMRKRG